SLATVFVALSGAVKAQPSLSISLNSGASYICKPGTVTLNATANSGYGCLYAYAQYLEWSLDGSTGWVTKKNFSGATFTGNGSASLTFSSDLTAITDLKTGYYRLNIIGNWQYCCVGVCCAYWCGTGVNSPNISAIFLYNDAGPDKSYVPACGGRVQIGTASSSYNACSPTYSWSPTTDLWTAQTGGSACGCTIAQPWAAGPPSGSRIYTRQMTCGGNVCNDAVTVTYSGVGCRTELLGDADIMISPNPSSGHFSLSSKNSDMNEIFIYNNLGKLIQHFKTADSNKDIFLEHGVYRIRILNEKGTRSSTLVVN
ncbi:MAG TPA: T9SS type A sorting domain-containing protein, partial [Bacteroidia bacterium]|nr:T9SS type A sorting domain-containing protein [Bacteroidia bacterium]